MSNVQECIDLYLTDEEVSDAQFRAVIVDARARDLIDGMPGPIDALHDEVAEIGRGLVLLNRVDDVRRDQFEALLVRVDKLTGFCDSLAGQVRVLRERLDNLEGK
jgi:hypothetical protein